MVAHYLNYASAITTVFSISTVSRRLFYGLSRKRIDIKGARYFLLDMVDFALLGDSIGMVDRKIPVCVLAWRRIIGRVLCEDR